MKPHKYREDLQNRTISPSPDSWERLNGKLSSHENNNKGRNWLFLKIASAILVFISIGFYFLKQPQEIISPQKIAAPASKEKLNKIPVADDIIETEIAVTPKKVSSKKKTEIESIRNQEPVNEVAFTQPSGHREISVIKNTEATMTDAGKEETAGTEIVHPEELLIDDEIEQLLSRSKIKLIVNGEISSKKLVNADALLNSVEDDLDKDLKQKLLEKIVNTIKKDKEVVTSKEN
jgi:hypothetical protein